MNIACLGGPVDYSLYTIGIFNVSIGKRRIRGRIGILKRTGLLGYGAFGSGKSFSTME
jgi:hypothetical protein